MSGAVVNTNRNTESACSSVVLFFVLVGASLNLSTSRTVSSIFY